MAEEIFTFSTDRIKFAVPKKGRIYEKVLELLKGCDIKFARKPRLDFATVLNMPIDLVFLPAADIAMYVAEGNVDLGITGQDIVEETGLTVVQECELAIGACKLCLQVPVSSGIKDPKTLLGKRVVTSFPKITQNYFNKLAGNANHNTQIKVVHGSVEAACAMGLADCIVDLVETGETMRACGLEVCSEIRDTQSILISNPHSPHKDMIERIKKRINGYITATKYCYFVYNIAKANLPEAEKITPGKRSPTISTLEDSNYVSVSVLVKRSEIQDIMDKLEQIGATDMLIFDLKNTRGF